MDRIRTMREKDFPAIALFWALNGTYADPKSLYPLETSYVYERDGEVLYAVAVHQVKGLPMAYVECVIRDPNKRSDFNALSALQAHLEQACRAEGYTKIVGIPQNEALCKHYEKLGYNRLGSVIYATKEI